MWRFVFYFVPVLVLLLANVVPQLDTFFVDFHWARKHSSTTRHYGWPRSILRVRHDTYERTTIYPSAKLPLNSTTSRWSWHGAFTNVIAIVFAIGICWRSWAVRERDRLHPLQWNMRTLFLFVTVAAIIVGFLQAGFHFPFAAAGAAMPTWLRTGYEGDILNLIACYCMAIILWRTFAIVPGLLKTSASHRT